MQLHQHQDDQKAARTAPAKDKIKDVYNKILYGKTIFSHAGGLKYLNNYLIDQCDLVDQPPNITIHTAMTLTWLKIANRCWLQLQKAAKAAKIVLCVSVFYVTIK